MNREQRQREWRRERVRQGFSSRPVDPEFEFRSRRSYKHEFERQTTAELDAFSWAHLEDIDE